MTSRAGRKAALAAALLILACTKQPDAAAPQPADLVATAPPVQPPLAAVSLALAPTQAVKGSDKNKSIDLLLVRCRESASVSLATHSAVQGQPTSYSGWCPNTPGDPSPGALQAGLDGGLPLDPVVLEAYLRATAACPLGEVDVEPSCPQLRQFLQARRNLAAGADMAVKLAAAGMAELSHASATVRILAFQLATAEWSTHRAQLLHAAEGEVDSRVQRAQLHFAFVAAAAQGGSAELAHWTLAKLPLWRTAERQAVRLHALERLAVASLSIDPPLPATAVTALCGFVGASLSAPDELERSVACMKAGPACPDAVQAHLAKPGLASAEVSACDLGLLRGWCAAPGYATGHRKAYEGLLSRLQAPHIQDRPGFLVLQELSCAQPLVAGATSQSAEATAWKQRVAFVDMQAIRTALAQVVESELAPSFSRAEALRTVLLLGAPPALVKRWQARWGKAEFGVEGQLRRALQLSADR